MKNYVRRIYSPLPLTTQPPSQTSLASLFLQRSSFINHYLMKKYLKSLLGFLIFSKFIIFSTFLIYVLLNIYINDLHSHLNTRNNKKQLFNMLLIKMLIYLFVAFYFIFFKYILFLSNFDLYRFYSLI